MSRRSLGAVDDEHRLAIEVFGAHPLGAGQRMVRRHGDVVDGDSGERGRGDVVRFRDRSADDAGGDRSRAHSIEDAQRRQPVGTHDSVGTGGVQGGDRLHHRRLAAVAVAERPRRRRGGELAGRGGEPVHRPQNPSRLVEQSFAGRRQRHPPARPREQLQAERRFELGDPLRQRRRRDVQARRGATEVAFLGHSDEVAQPP